MCKANAIFNSIPLDPKNRSPVFLFQKYTPPVCLSSTAVHVSLGSLLITWFVLSLSWLVGCCASALPGGALLLLLRELLSANEQVWKLSTCKEILLFQPTEYRLWKCAS